MSDALPPPGFEIGPLEDTDTLRALLQRRWGETLVMFGRAWKIGDFSALIATDARGTHIGLATYALQRAMILVLTVDNFSDKPGVGKALLAHAAAIGRAHGARTMRVLTTNDNTPALRYFQMQGFRIAAFYPGAISVYRAVSPTLPQTGVDGIPMRDALELEIDL